MHNICAYCHKVYEPKRVTSRFCSDNCRVKYSRLEQRLEGRMYSILKDLQEMQKLNRKYPELGAEIDKHLELIQGKVAFMRIVSAQKP